MGDVEKKAPLPGKRVTSGSKAIKKGQDRVSAAQKAVSRAQRQRNKATKSAERAQAVREAQRSRG